MPALPVIANVFRCALRWHSFLGGDAVNVMHFETAGPGATEAQVFACLDAHVTTNMWAAMEPSCHCNTVDVLKLDGTSATHSFSTGAPAKWSGNSTGDALPAVAQVVKLTGPFRGRSHRGRIFVPYVGEAAIAAGTITSTVTGLAQTAWNTFLAGVAADATTPMNLVIASYKLGTADNVTTVTCEPVAGTQRRRQSRLRP